MHPDLVSRPEAARMLNITTKTLDRWVARGVIRKIQVFENSRVYFRRADVVALLEPVDTEDHAA